MQKRGFSLNLNHVGPLIANHPAGRQLHATASLCRASQGARIGSKGALSHGVAEHHPRCTATCMLLLSSAVCPSSRKSPQPLLGCHLPAISTCFHSVACHLPSPSIICRECHTIAWTHPRHRVSSWPLLGWSMCLCLTPLSEATATAAEWERTPGWAGAYGGALKSLKIATIEMMQCRAMLSPYYLLVKDEAVVNITFMGLPIVWNALHMHYNQLHPGFCWWHSTFLGTASVTLLESSSSKTPMGMSRRPSKMHGYPSSPSVLHREKQRNASHWHWTHGD